MNLCFTTTASWPPLSLQPLPLYSLPSCLPPSTFPRTIRFFLMASHFVENSTWAQWPQEGIPEARSYPPPAHSASVLWKDQFISFRAPPNTQGSDEIPGRNQQLSLWACLVWPIAKLVVCEWPCFLAITEIPRHQKSLHGGESCLLKLTDQLDWPCSSIFIRAIPSHQRGFWWENNNKMSPSSITPMFYFISNSLGTHAIIKYKENDFINSGLSLW